jgi:hypothetical protein
MLIDSQDAPRHQHEEVARKPLTQSNTLSQSEHDWAFAKRALSRGDDPEEVIRITAPQTSTILNITHVSPCRKRKRKSNADQLARMMPADSRNKNWK